MPVKELRPGEIEPIAEPPSAANGKPLQPEALRLRDRFWLSRLKGARWPRRHRPLDTRRAGAARGRAGDPDLRAAGQGEHGAAGAQPDLLAELRYYAEVLGLNPRDRARLGIDLAGAVSAEVRMNEILDRLARGEDVAVDDLSGARGRSRMARSAGPETSCGRRRARSASRATRG